MRLSMLRCGSSILLPLQGTPTLTLTLTLTMALTLNPIFSFEGESLQQVGVAASSLKASTNSNRNGGSQAYTRVQLPPLLLCFYKWSILIILNTWAGVRTSSPR